MSLDSKPARTESRQFDLATKIGVLKGLIEGLVSKCGERHSESIHQIGLALEAVDSIDLPVTMAAKNKHLYTNFSGLNYYCNLTCS